MSFLDLLEHGLPGFSDELVNGGKQACGQRLSSLAWSHLSSDHSIAGAAGSAQKWLCPDGIAVRIWRAFDLVPICPRQAFARALNDSVEP